MAIHRFPYFLAIISTCILFKPAAAASTPLPAEYAQSRLEFGGVPVFARHLAPILRSRRRLQAAALPIQSWIVTLKSDADVDDSQAADSAPSAQTICDNAEDATFVAYNATCSRVFSHALSGMVVQATPRELQSLLAANRQVVDFVELDAASALHATTQGTYGYMGNAWHLDRLDQASLPLDQQYTFDNDGRGVHAYMIDSGINRYHREYNGRVVMDLDLIADGQNGADCNGHGTHVAGILVGTTFGVAKAATLHNIRTQTCSGAGTMSTILSALDWVMWNRVSPSVVSISIGGAYTQSVNNAVEALVASGCPVVVSAGNSNGDATEMSPASAPSAITVGATEDDDAIADYSNWGAGVDIFAPGSYIPSADTASTTGYVFKSGTSMAAPLVSGLVAQFLQSYPDATPATVLRKLLESALQGAVQGDLHGAPNVLAHPCRSRPRHHCRRRRRRRRLSRRRRRAKTFGMIASIMYSTATATRLAGRTWGATGAPCPAENALPLVRAPRRRARRRRQARRRRRFSRHRLVRIAFTPATPGAPSTARATRTAAKTLETTGAP